VFNGFIISHKWKNRLPAAGSPPKKWPKLQSRNNGKKGFVYEDIIGTFDFLLYSNRFSRGAYRGAGT